VAWGACCIEAALALTIIVDTIMWWGWPDDARPVIQHGACAMVRSEQRASKVSSEFTSEEGYILISGGIWGGIRGIVSCK